MLVLELVVSKATRRASSSVALRRAGAVPRVALMASFDRASIEAALGVRAVERESGYLYVELLTGVRRHAVAADHDARRCLQRTARRVAEGFTGLKDRH